MKIVKLKIEMSKRNLIGWFCIYLSICRYFTYVENQTIYSMKSCLSASRECRKSLETSITLEKFKLGRNISWNSQEIDIDKV